MCYYVTVCVDSGVCAAVFVLDDAFRGAVNAYDLRTTNLLHSRLVVRIRMLFVSHYFGCCAALGPGVWVFSRR